MTSFAYCQGLRSLQEVLVGLSKRRLTALPLQGVSLRAYPPENMEGFVQTLFLQGGTSQASARHKLALLLYCLLDRQGGAAGQKLNLESFR